MNKTEFCASIVLLAALALLIISTGRNATIDNKVKFHKKLPVDVSGLQHKPPRTAKNEFISITYEVYANHFDNTQPTPATMIVRYTLTKTPSPLNNLLNKETVTVFDVSNSANENINFFELEKNLCANILQLFKCKHWSKVGPFSDHENDLGLENNPLLTARFFISGSIFGATFNDPLDGLDDLEPIINQPDIRELLANPQLLQKLLEETQF